jgi:Carboxypeptidase regulatory-like domain
LSIFLLFTAVYTLIDSAGDTQNVVDDCKASVIKFVLLGAYPQGSQQVTAGPKLLRDPRLTAPIKLRSEGMAADSPFEKTAGTKSKEFYIGVSEIEALGKSAMELESQYLAMLPKVGPRLIADLLRVQRENPHRLSIFTLEVFTKKAENDGIDPDTIREHIWNTTGKMPAICDNGTHYVTNQKITLETLKRLNDFEHALNVSGEYCGGSYASTAPEHECFVELKELRRPVRSESSSKEETEKKNKEKTSVLKIVLFTIIGIVGVVALGGFVISGGIPPNAHSNDDVTAISLGQEPGKLYGYVGGPVVGLPAIGASIVAANMETGDTANSLISIDGKYYLDLLPGTYSLVVAFPDGTSQAYDDVVIKRGTASEMNITYH